MESLPSYLIYLHAFLGGLGLLSGVFTISVKKGGSLHKKAGKVFSYTMGGSAILALIISSLPGHHNSFLFLIGLFTLYMVLSGYRALAFAYKPKADLTDKVISWTMLLAGIGMLVFGALGLIKGEMGYILFAFFGGIALFLSLRDLLFFHHLEQRRKSYLIFHIGKMVGALIASFTAFLVTAIGMQNLWGWMLPSILGTILIVYWIRKIKSANQN